MKKISNPLTIIGIFAGIAEVAGTVVFPLVSQELQHVFIWYVMGLPVFLVLAFFITLNFNPKVLYAPSNFADENNFLKLWNAIVIDKKIEDVKEKNPNIAPDLETIQLTLLNSVAMLDRNKYKKHIEVMKLIASKKNGITANELANDLSVTVSYAHRLLKDLENSGLVIYINDIEKTDSISRKVKRYVVVDQGDTQ